MDGGNYGDTANSISMLIADTTVFKGNMGKAAIFSTKYKKDSNFYNIFLQILLTT